MTNRMGDPVESDIWSVDLLDVPMDGSCFFTSIVTAMNESMDLIQDNDFIRGKMEKYWEDYVNEHKKDVTCITSHMLRNICSKNIDSDIFEMYCIDASARKDAKERGVQVFKTLGDMRKTIENTNYWGDHSCIRAFFNAFDNRISLIIFDEDYGGIVYFQKEWTEDKDMYICIQRHGNHYRPMVLSKKGERLRMCITRSDVLDFVNDTNKYITTKIMNIY